MIMEIIGWLGAVMVLGAYVLLSLRKIQSESYLYHGMNIIGALLLGVYTFSKDAVPSALLNVIWAMVGLYAVWSIFSKSRNFLP